LLGHELAYCLGQIGSSLALPTLQAVLVDKDHIYHPMVRHEAAEAMGAISDLSSLEILKRYRDAPEECLAVKETCEIAVAKIEYDHLEQSGGGGKIDRSKYDSIDPAPPLSMHLTATSPTTLSIPLLRSTLLDSSLSLFQRYRAMFALRNIASASSSSSKEAVLALADGFSDSSALFRHEIAYIFGQLSSPHSIPSLIQVLNNGKEDEMVRHEAAEALGSIAEEGVLPVLKEWATRPDSPQVVRESCEVALDMYEYENSGQLDYAERVVPSSQSLPMPISV